MVLFWFKLFDEELCKINVFIMKDFCFFEYYWEGVYNVYYVEEC